MPEQLADVCDVCGRIVAKKNHADSSGMVMLSGADAFLLLLADIPKGKSGRESFVLAGKRWCPPCLIQSLKDWLGIT